MVPPTDLGVAADTDREWRGQTHKTLFNSQDQPIKFSWIPLSTHYSLQNHFLPVLYIPLLNSALTPLSLSFC